MRDTGFSHVWKRDVKKSEISPQTFHCWNAVNIAGAITHANSLTMCMQKLTSDFAMVCHQYDKLNVYAEVNF